MWPWAGRLFSSKDLFNRQTKNRTRLFHHMARKGNVWKVVSELELELSNQKLSAFGTIKFLW